MALGSNIEYELPFVDSITFSPQAPETPSVVLVAPNVVAGTDYVFVDNKVMIEPDRSIYGEALDVVRDLAGRLGDPTEIAHSGYPKDYDVLLVPEPSSPKFIQWVSLDRVLTGIGRGDFEASIKQIAEIGVKYPDTQASTPRVTI